MNLKFSIITVVFNDSENILQTLSSIINQTYKNIQCIIIDGDSNDGTKEKVLSYLQDNTHFVKKICTSNFVSAESYHKDFINLTFNFLSQKDKGIFDAMNKGISLATGDYTCFINSGDFLFSKKTLEEIQNTINFNNLYSYDAVYGKLNLLYPNLGIQKTRDTFKDMSKLYKLFYGFGHPNCLFKTSILHKNNYDTSYKLASDYDLIYRLYKQGYSFCFVDTIIATFTSGGASDQNGFSSLKEALDIALKNNKNPIVMIKILCFFLFSLSKKMVKKYFPNTIMKFLLNPSKQSK
ncbi:MULTISPECIES: glycosyltransferase family 2 protein [unclassified Helicobacter]|uniref:glycosyltransferase family 2 protein n=1 Tax=unclassified Helicobacter TaxID=2593540 RepID=UPI000CF0FFB1|nr:MULTISPECIES: glycosyltransferase family 2 protein [unclassified Helicobacter]